MCARACTGVSVFQANLARIVAHWRRSDVGVGDRTPQTIPRRPVSLWRLRRRPSLGGVLLLCPRARWRLEPVVVFPPVLQITQGYYPPRFDICYSVKLKLRGYLLRTPADNFHCLASERGAFR